MANKPKTGIQGKKVARFFSAYPKKVYLKNSVIVSPGKRSQQIYFLKSGLVKATATSPRGESFVIHQYRPGAFFDLKWLVSAKQNSYFYQAVTKVTIQAAPLSQVKKWLQKDPDLLWTTFARILLGLEGSMKRFEINMTRSVNTRVASLLSYLANKYGQKSPSGVAIPFHLTHQEIASWVGATRETVSLEIERLQKKGVVEKKKGQLVIKNRSGLKI